MSNVVIESSSQKAVFSITLTKPIITTFGTYIEHSGMMRSEGHNNSGFEDELLVLKITKGKGNKRSRESARLQELTRSSEKPRLLKVEFRLVLAEYVDSVKFYDSSCVNKFNLIKRRGMIVESCYLEQSLIDHGLLELFVDAKFLIPLDLLKCIMNRACKEKKRKKISCA